MAREWILNSAANRFQLNFKRNVGAVVEKIRKCAPKIQWFMILWGFMMFLCIVFLLCLFSETFSEALKSLLDIERKHEALRFIGFGIGGVLAAIGAVAINRRANAQVENNAITERGHIQDRFRAAAEHLGHERAEMRTIAYYEFYQLAKNNADLRENILDILCAHLRQITNASDYEGKNKPAITVQILLNLLFKPEPENKDIFRNLKINLRGVHLVGANLACAHMPNVDFTGARLIGANMRLANLHKCNFTGANMHGVYLDQANMPLATLINTLLCGSSIIGTNLQQSTLLDTDFRGSHCGESPDSTPTQMHGVKSCLILSGNKAAYMGGVFSNSSYDGYQSMINNRINMKGNIDNIVFDGGTNILLDKQVTKTTIFLKNYVSEGDAEKYQRKMKEHLGKNPTKKYDAEKDGISLTAYTGEDAKKWIEQYNKAMRHVSDNE